MKNLHCVYVLQSLAHPEQIYTGFFGIDAASVLKSLPKFGPLFSRTARVKENHHAKKFMEP
jgi:hypothetical protein